MVFRTTSIKRWRAAMTLVEVLMATAVGGLVLSAVASLMVYNVRSLAALSNYADLDRYSRNAVDRISRDVRQAATLASFTSTELRFTFPTASDVYYTYSSDSKTLVRRQGTDRAVLLEECDALTFTVYGRNNISNSWDQFEVTTAANAKLIKLNWTCSRTILGEARNTESIQTAKIVLRKQD